MINGLFWLSKHFWQRHLNFQFEKINFFCLFIFFCSQHLVDWTKAMVPQISKMGAQYSDWVHKPVDRNLRLFEQNYLEMLTKTPWWLVPVYWIPIICLLAFLGAHEAYAEDNRNVSLYMRSYYPRFSLKY